MTDESQSNPISDHPILFTLAVLTGAALVAGALFLVGAFTDSEEAPIRVKNGSLELHLLTQHQKWEEQGKGSGNYSVSNAKRFKEEFEVTVAVRGEAACSPSKTATGKDVVLTYRDETGKDWEVRLESAGHKTKVKPNGFMFTLSADQKLTYGTPNQGFITKIVVTSGGNPPDLCTFTQRDQLDHLIILNAPQ